MNRGVGWLMAFIWLLVASALYSCSNGDDDAGNTVRFYGPDERGPYKVGVKTLYLVDQSRYETWGRRYRTLPLEIWYPSTGAGGEPNRIRDMVGELPSAAMCLLRILYGDDLEGFLNTATSSLRDSEILIPQRPFPVIFFSHGFGGLRFQNYTLCEHLASHGFVITAPDHYGNAIFLTLPGGELILFNPFASISTYSDRLKDVEFVFHELQTMNQDTLNPWNGVFDLERFAMNGHSYGGLTSILCDAEFDFVKAAAPMNPAWLCTQSEDIVKPFYMLQGENDSTVGIMNEATKKIWDSASTTHKVFINMTAGEHYSATDACALIPPVLTFLTKQCEPPNIDPDLANHISYSYLTSFFKSVLDHDSRYDSYLNENHFKDEIELEIVW